MVRLDAQPIASAPSSSEFAMRCAGGNGSPMSPFSPGAVKAFHPVTHAII